MDITVNQMMKIEENSHALGVHKKLMMENAGSSIAKFLVMRFKDLTSKHILIFVGLGNNGGDAFQLFLVFVRVIMQLLYYMQLPLLAYFLLYFLA